MPDPDEAPVRLPLVDASSRLGISVDALRSRIRRGMATARRGNDGRLLVEVAAEAPPSHDLVTPSPDADTLGELQAEIGELRVAVAKFEAERDAAREIASATIAAMTRVVDRLERELADARRPWLARLLAAIRRPG